jgi:MFS family permease
MTISEEKKRELKKAAVVFAYVSLFVISLAAMTSYFSTDLIRPIVTEFKENMGYTTAQVNLLSSIYSLPPVIFLFFSGIITDKIGIRKSSLFLMALIAVGSYLVTFLDYKMILLGRLLIGLGAESFFVVMNKILTKWFKDKKLAMAFGLNLLLCRLGSIAAFNLLPWVVSSYSLKSALWTGAGLTILGFFLTILYCLIDKHGDEKGYVAVLDDLSEEPFRVKEAIRLPLAFWVITLLCVTYYSTIFPFTGVSKDLFVEKEKKRLVVVLEKKEMPEAVTRKVFEFISDENSLTGKTKAEKIAENLKESEYFESVSVNLDEKHVSYLLELRYSLEGEMVQRSAKVNRDFLTKPEFGEMPEALARKLSALIKDENVLKDKTRAENIAEELTTGKYCAAVSVIIDPVHSFYNLDLTYEFNGKMVEKSINRDFLNGPEYKALNQSKIDGASLTSLILIISMCVTWLFGLLIDKVGKRATLMIIGSIIMIPCHVSLVFTSIPPIIPMMVLGLSFALVPAALWPAVPLIVKEKNLGTAYGIIFMIQNIGLLVFEPLAGKFFDMTGNYKLSMVMFSTIGVIGLGFSVWLKILEKKGGGYLDTSKPKILQ